MATTAPQRARRRRLQNWISGAAILAVATTVAVVASGFDSQETPREDPSVWVARSSGQYARVNTETAEIDTVRLVDNPDAVVQTAGVNLVLAQGYGRAWTIDPTAPQDLQEGKPAGSEGSQPPSAPVAGDTGEQDQALRTPDGTRSVLSGRDVVLFHTDAGEAYLARTVQARGTEPAGLGSMTLLDPLAEERAAATAKAEAAGEEPEEHGYFVAAAAIDADNRVALYAPADGGVRWVDGTTGQFIGGVNSVPDEVPDKGVQLAIVSGKWVILDAANGVLWRQDGKRVELDISGEALLQGSTTKQYGGTAYVADERGLWSITSDGAVERIADTEGTPARPQQSNGIVAAWVTTSGASMWTTNGGLQQLPFDDSVEGLAEVSPAIRTNGSRAILAETQSGMMWTVPEGKLIPVEQWALVDPPKQRQGEVVAQDVADQEPPIAMPDEFGVRAGEPVLLPVLLNDFDPNRRDVLTIVPDGLGEGLSADFGRLSLLSDGQGITIQPQPSASGSATFSYRVTDGVNLSEPATVTLNVVASDVNTAPQWCPVVGCQRSWPSPEIAPGGTLVLSVLDGWVDPEGDPMVLARATVSDSSAPARALVTADGRLAVRHTDGNAPDGDIIITIAVQDSRGAETQRDLTLRVRSSAAIEFLPIAATSKVGEASILRPLDRVSGGSGSFQLVDAVVQQGSIEATVNHGSGTVEVLAQAAGSSTLSVTVRDTVTGQETTGIVRVTAVDSRGSFAIPPLRAFVRPMADTTIDVLASIPGANARALTVQSATVKDGQLRADVIEHSSIRIAGSTADGSPGRIGSIDVVITEGDTSVTGRITVFQVPESASSTVIAVADTATVRAGSVVDIPVLDNDVAPPGERLVLNPEIGAPGMPGELAFASGSRLRYLAPQTPGTYTLSYTTYGASSPEHSDVGRVTVTVLAEGSNRPPQPRTLTVRLAPGESVNTTVPLSGVDPDGDRVRLVSVDAPTDPQLTTAMQSRSSVIQVSASSRATRGTQLVPYLVRDAFGGEATGTLRVIVTDPDAGGGAPVVYSDYVRISRGSVDAATVRPLDNDLDPAGGKLELVSVEPNVPAAATALRAELAGRLDTSRLDDGIVKITGGNETGTFSFKYTVRSTASTSTADGLIVVQVSERIGVQAPAITDTVLSVRDRAEFAHTGVDVISDHVRWAAGDVADLQLSLWGSAADSYTVKGSNIIGSYRAEGDLVPFKLSGLDASGSEVESFGFLIVPPLDELRLNLKPNLAPITVKEGESIDVNVNDIIEIGSRDSIKIAQDGLSTQRNQASCAATGDISFRYNAGREAPWTDSCTIRVKLTDQNTYTSLAVPVSIIPDAPAVQLNPLTRTIAPGETQTISLTDMVAWQGGRAGDIGALVWQLTPLGGSFEVTVNGSSVQVLARADATPGAQQVANATVSGAGDSVSTLTLRVGEAVPDVPRGARVSLQCTVGAPCGTALVNRPGEYDPFQGKPGSGLHLVSIGSETCAYGTLSANGDAVTVGWPNSRGPGGQCTVSFTVRDGQGRTGTGTIELDAQGVPRAPASISQVGYGASSVQLEVALGEAANAHPGVTGVVIDMDGSRVNAGCVPAGGAYRCEVTGLTVGAQHTFTARAVNAVGESDPTANSVTAWAYRGPSAPQVQVTQLSAESATSGTVRIDMTSTDPTTGGYQVTAGGQTQNVGLGQSAEFNGLTVGPVTWQVVPISNVQLPSGGSANGDVATNTFALEGRPSLQLAASPVPGTNDVQITVVVSDNGGANTMHGHGTGIGVMSNPSCNAGAVASGPGSYSYSATGQKYRWMKIVACAQNEWGPAETVSTSVRVFGDASPPSVSSGFVVNPAPTPSGQYLLQTPPNVAAAGTFVLQYEVQGVLYAEGDPFPAVLDPNQTGSARVRQCADGECSGWAPITGNVPTAVTVMTPSCVDPANLEAIRLNISVPARASSTASIAYDPATQTLKITWIGAFSALTPLTAVVPECTPPPVPGGP